MPEDVCLAESAPLVEAASGAPKSRKFRARLIAGDIQGSSGFYPAKMLKESASVFREGLAIYLDHPGMSESVDRPERSVRDLAGKLASTAVYERDGLYADIEVYPHMAPVIEAMAGDIGMSIRASGTVEGSTSESIRGPIVTSITAAESVDFVTAAGAGGKIVSLLESARANAPADLPKATPLVEARNVGQWLESRLHLTFTQLADDMFGNGRLTREERIALSSAIGDGLAAFTTRVTADQPQLYQRDLWDEPSGDAEMVESTPEPKTPDPPMAEPVTETEPGTQPIEEKGAIVPEITEEQSRQLAEAATVKAALDAANAKLAEADKAEADRTAALAESQAQKAAADLKLARFEAVEAARPIAATLLTESALPSAAQVRVLGEAVTSAKVPLRDGILDEPVFRANIAEAIKAEETYLASLQEGAGAGQPRGLGESKAPEGEVPDAKATESALVEAFKLRGMSPEAAQLAASGRRF